jgi:pilus assembly protein CpaF
VPHSLGVLQSHLDNPDISEVMVVDGHSLWLEDAHGIHSAGTLTPEQVNQCVERICRASGRRVDLLSPVLDARLNDGSRACVVIPPISVGGTTISIRKFPKRILPLAAFGPSSCSDAIKTLIRERKNVVVSGATSSGKTSLLSAAASHFHASERIVVVEDTAELRFMNSHVVRLQTRPTSIENDGEVTLQQLVRTSLRLRPDRLIVGEVRGAEAVDMLLALTSGHHGSWATVHATSATDTLDRLATMITRDSPQWSQPQARYLVNRGVDAVIHITRNTNGKRSVSEIVHFDQGEPSTLYKAPR